MWHLSAWVAKTGRMVPKSTYRVEPMVSYGRRIGLSAAVPSVEATMAF